MVILQNFIFRANLLEQSLTRQLLRAVFKLDPVGMVELFQNFIWQGFMKKVFRPKRLKEISIQWRTDLG